jgi:hypothetical protein
MYAPEDPEVVGNIRTVNHAMAIRTQHSEIRDGIEP